MLAVQAAEWSSCPLTPCLRAPGQAENLGLILRRWLAALVYS
jgi:hypothetical protein